MGCGSSVEPVHISGHPKSLTSGDQQQQHGKQRKKKRVTELTLRYEVYYREEGEDGTAYDSENYLFTPFQNQISAAFQNPKLNIQFVKLNTADLRIVLTSLNDTPVIAGDHAEGAGAASTTTGGKQGHGVVLVHDDAPLALESYSLKALSTAKAIRAIRARVAPTDWRPWLRKDKMITAFKSVVNEFFDLADRKDDMANPPTHASPVLSSTSSSSPAGATGGGGSGISPMMGTHSLAQLTNSFSSKRNTDSERTRKQTIVMDELYLLEFVVTPSSSAIAREQGSVRRKGLDEDGGYSDLYTTTNNNTTPQSHYRDLESKTESRMKDWPGQFLRAIDDLREAVEFYTREECGDPPSESETSQKSEEGGLVHNLSTQKWLDCMSKQLVELRAYFFLFATLCSSAFGFPNLQAILYGDDPKTGTYALERVFNALNNGSSITSQSHPSSSSIANSSASTSAYPTNLLNSPLVKGRTCEPKLRQALATSRLRKRTLTLGALHALWPDLVQHANVSSWTPAQWQIFGATNPEEDAGVLLTAGWSLWAASLVEYLFREMDGNCSGFLELDETDLGIKQVLFRAYRDIKEKKVVIEEFFNTPIQRPWQSTRLMHLDPTRGQVVTKSMFRFFVAVNCHCLAENLPQFMRSVLEWRSSEAFMSEVLPTLQMPIEERLDRLFHKIVEASPQIRTVSSTDKLLAVSSIPPQVMHASATEGFTKPGVSPNCMDLEGFRGAMRKRGVLENPEIARGVERYWYLIHHKFQC